MTSYLIRRYGSNAANQSMTPVMPVAIVEAKSRDEAVTIAAERVTVYNNQVLEAVPVSKARKSELQELRDLAATEAAYSRA